MKRSRRRFAAGVLAALVLVAAGAPAASAAPQHPPERGWPFAVVRPQATDRHWDPLTPGKWAFADGQVIMTERGEAPEGPRRPFEYAVVETGPELASFSYRAEVRIDEPVTRNDRDVILVFNYRSPTRFYYVHLSQDNTIYPHNGIFVVDDADRERIDDQWNGTTGAPAAIDDTGWHEVRLEHHAPSGRTAVHLDGSDEPLMTAVDTSFSGGRVGFGSFDNHGRIRDVTVAGTKARPGASPR